MMNIFSAGIVWDPREPLPFELQHRVSGGRKQPVRKHVDLRGRNISNFDTVVDDESGSGQSSRAFVTHPPATVNLHEKLPDGVIKEPTRNVLPPLSISVDAKVVQDTAQVTVTQLYWNNGDLLIPNAFYTFPLPNGCTVTGFSCRVGREKMLRGSIKPREEAREAFNSAVARGEKAGLLEQGTPEIFTTALGNIPPNVRLRTEITYIVLLKRGFADRRNTTTFTIPTCIGSRYGDPPAEFVEATSSEIPRGLSINIEVVESERVRDIISKTHGIVVDYHQGSRTASSWEDLVGKERSGRAFQTASVRLDNGSTFLDRDCVLQIETEPSTGVEEAQAWLEEHPTLQGHHALMLTIPPSFMMADVGMSVKSEGEILFLVDCSGSMYDKMTALKSAMNFFLKGIPQGRRFNIWCFGSDYKSLWPRSVDYTEETLYLALQFVKQDISDDMGGTELLPAMEAVIAARDKSVPCDIIVLTDGQVWRLDATLDVVQRERTLSEGRLRFFALGIGHAVSHALVEGIAKRGGGYSEVIASASSGGWEDRVVAMLKAATTKHVSPLTIEYGPLSDSSMPGVLRSPADMSSFNLFQGNRVFLLLDHTVTVPTTGPITIRTRTSDGAELSRTAPVGLVEKKDATLHQLGARAVLEDLERGQAGSWVRHEATRIACKYSLVSKWTSFFLKEEEFKPQGSDPFMDAVIQVRDTSDSMDLLQPRGAQRALPPEHPSTEAETEAFVASCPSIPAVIPTPPTRQTWAAVGLNDPWMSPNRWMGEKDDGPDAGIASPAQSVRLPVVSTIMSPVNSRNTLHLGSPIDQSSSLILDSGSLTHHPAGANSLPVTNLSHATGTDIPNEMHQGASFSQGVSNIYSVRRASEKSSLWSLLGRSTIGSPGFLRKKDPKSIRDEEYEGGDGNDSGYGVDGGGSGDGGDGDDGGYGVDGGGIGDDGRSSYGGYGDYSYDGDDGYEVGYSDLGGAYRAYNGGSGYGGGGGYDGFSTFGSNDWEPASADVGVPSMLPTAPSPRDGEHAKELVRELLVYQQFDGSFAIDVDKARDIMGFQTWNVAWKAVQDASAVEGVCPPAPEAVKFAAAVLLLFEALFQSCKDLWELMWTKGMAFIKQHVPNEAQRARFLSRARESLKDMGSVLPDEAAGQGDEDIVVKPSEEKGSPSRRVAVHFAPRD